MWWSIVRKILDICKGDGHALSLKTEAETSPLNFQMT